ncbi:MAG: hypothetical protein ABSG74_11035 [Candidatus Bathyarchaeia archaeon]
MAVTTRGYRHALFVRLKDFDLSELAGLSHVTKEKGGYTIKLGRRRTHYFVHPVKANLVALETDDKRTRDEVVRNLASFVRGRGKRLERATLETRKVFEYLHSFEQDGMLAEGKLHLYFRDRVTIETPSGPEIINRTKIVWRNRDVAEARKLTTDLGWEVTGASLTIERGEDRHYGIVRIHPEPTARVSKGAIPVSDNLHELLAKRLVDFLDS